MSTSSQSLHHLLVEYYNSLKGTVLPACHEREHMHIHLVFLRNMATKTKLRIVGICGLNSTLLRTDLSKADLSNRGVLAIKTTIIEVTHLLQPKTLLPLTES
jgi:hypothetical protein